MNLTPRPSARSTGIWRTLRAARGRRSRGGAPGHAGKRTRADQCQRLRFYAHQHYGANGKKVEKYAERIAEPRAVEALEAAFKRR